ncbi:MAG: hypothetical protein JNM33_02035 [Rubrivivax sp.]|nr:hypothetical protein [Rubrivivax sp.]
MLRAVVALLLLANLAFFAWARGWLEPVWPAPRHAEHEPQRLAAQLRPDAVIVLTPKAATAAIAAARAAAAMCLQAGPLAEAEIPAAEAALAPLQLPEGSLAREPAKPSPGWLVFAGRWPDAGERKAREEELKKLGLAYEVIGTPADLAPGFVLSRHATRAEAESALAVLAAASQPLRRGRVVNLPPEPPRFWLRVARADVDTQTRLLGLQPPAVAATGGGFKPCSAAS